jgi:hypothetical protein
MTDQPVKDRAAYYLVRSAEARAKADAMSDTEAKANMLQVAALWELMAKCEAHYQLSQLSQRSPGSGRRSRVSKPSNGEQQSSAVKRWSESGSSS